MNALICLAKFNNGFLQVVLAAAVLVFLCAFSGGQVSAAISLSGEYELESSVRDSGGGAVLSGGGYVSKGSAGQNLLAGEQGNSISGEYVNRTGFYNPPHFTFQKGLVSVVDFNSGTASLVLPPSAVDKRVFDITLNNDPLAQPLNVDPSLIASANGKMEQNEGSWARLLSENITEMSIFDEQDVWQRPFAEAGSLSMRYQDVDGDGVLDASNPPIRADTVKPWALDETAAMWVKLPSSSFDKTVRTVTVPLRSPGVFALLGTMDESVKDTYAFPVPFRPNGPNAGAGAGQSGVETDGITFTNVPQSGNVEIYTLDGRLVRKLPIPSGLVLPKIKWDVRAESGTRVASGVYIWRVVSGGNSKTGKLMVIW